jgi:hypothetical protein
MAHVTKHNSKQERECNSSENSRINLFVHWYTIGVDDLLEWP